MNTKSYIGRFSEISHLSDRKQQELLEKARYQYFAVQKHGGKGALCLLVAIIPAVLAPVVTQLLFGYSFLYSSIAIGLGVFLGTLAAHKLYGSFLRKGLASI